MYSLFQKQYACENSTFVLILNVGRSLWDLKIGIGTRFSHITLQNNLIETEIRGETLTDFTISSR